MENNNLPDTLGRTYITRLSHFYSILWKNKYDITPLLSYSALGKVFKELKGLFSEYQIAFLLIIYFEWKGANENDFYIEKKLQNSTHSIYLFKNEIDPIRAYVKNRLKIDLDGDEICPLVDKTITNYA